MRTVAKHSYIRTSWSRSGKQAKGAAQAHLRYVQHRPGRDVDELQHKQRQFFDAERNSVTQEQMKALINEQVDYGVVVHKLILSPGVANVDLVDYTRQLLSELGRAKGLDLVWGGIIHKNTDHEHVHVLMMGKDEQDKTVRLDARHDYKLLREVGDRYIERYHNLDRYLDREVPDMLRKGYQRDTGDRSYENMLRELKGLPAQEAWSKEDAIDSMPQHEKVTYGGREYTRYDSSDDLRQLGRSSVSSEDKLSRKQRSMLRGWIGAKDARGEDIFERTDKKEAETLEQDRLAMLFGEELKRMLSEQGLRRPMGRQQYVFESSGRHLESHERYQITTSIKDLQNEQKQVELTPERAQQIELELKWLYELRSDYRRDYRQDGRNGKDTMSEKHQKSQIDDKDKKHRDHLNDDRRQNDKVVVLDEKRSDNQQKLPDSNGEGVYRDKDHSGQQSPSQQDRDQQQSSQQQEGQQEQSLDPDEQHHLQDQQEYEQEFEQELERLRGLHDDDQQEQSLDPDEQHHLKDKLEYEQEQEQEQERRRQEQLQLEQEERDRQMRLKEEITHMLSIQHQADVLRRQQVELGNTGSRFPIGSAQSDRFNQYSYQVDSSIKALEDIERSNLQPAAGPLDLFNDIESNWSLEEKASHDFDEFERALDQLDHDRLDHDQPQHENQQLEQNQDHDHQLNQDQSQTEHAPWFITGSDDAHNFHQMAADQQRLLLWERAAYDPDLLERQRDTDSPQQDHQLQQDQSQIQQLQSMQQQQTQQALDLQIQRIFIDAGHKRDDEDNEHGNEERGAHQ
jgi:hypothetical protein